MGAQTRITQDGSFISLLANLTELVKNPSSIEEAYNKVREQSALTDEQIKKTQEAAQLIGRYDEITKELSTRESEIIASQQKLAEDKDQLAEDVKSKQAQITLDLSTLNERRDSHDAKERDLLAKTKAFKEEYKLFMDRATEEDNRLQKIESQLQNREKLISEKMNSVKELENKYLARMEQLKSIIN